METNNNRIINSDDRNLQEEDQTTGSGYSQQERNREDSTNGDTDELDPNYYSDKENPKKSDNSVDSNRSENPDATEGVEPNR